MLSASAPAPGGPSASGRRLATPARAIVLALVLALVATAGARAQEIYLAFGDSITEGVGDDPARAEKGYPPRLEALLQAAGRNAVVVNSGIEGETTAEGISRINGVIAATDADVLLLMEGTNDIPLVSNETVQRNLQEIARRAAALGVTTIHSTLFPRHNTAGLDPNNDQTAQASGLIRELAYETNRRLADPFEVFFNIPNVFTLYFPPGDKFHPNAAGYDRMAQIWFEVIQGIDRVPPVVGRMRPLDKSENVAPGTNISIDLYDFGAGINLSRTSIRIDGETVNATLRGDNRKVEVVYQPPSPLRGVVDVDLVSEDLANPVNAVDRRVSRFIVSGTTFLNGDTNRDGRVDGGDLVRLAIAFGASRGEPRYLASADLNSDNLIDGSDLAILASNFGKESG